MPVRPLPPGAQQAPEFVETLSSVEQILREDPIGIYGRMDFRTRDNYRHAVERVARAAGGRYVRAGEAGRIVPWLEDARPSNAAPERRDLWHTPWTFAFIALLLSAEWILRRFWGLR